MSSLTLIVLQNAYCLTYDALKIFLLEISLIHILALLVFIRFS